MKEKDFIKQLRHALDKKFHGNYVCHWKNNNDTLPGQPDLEFIVKGFTYYLECKYVNKNFKDIKPFSIENILKHPFSKPQYKFAYLITKAGGNAGGIIGFKDVAYYIPPADLKYGNFIAEDLLKSYPSISKVDGIWDVDMLTRIMMEWK